MALTQLSIRAGNQAIPVNGDLGGSLFKNNGPDTVYYGPDRATTSATGTSVASGASATLVGTQYLVVAGTLGTLAKVTVTPTYTGSEGDAEVVTRLQVTGGLALTDAADVTVGTTTGSKIGQASSKVSFFGATPVVQPGAYTQTYSTAARTVPNATVQAVATTASTQTTPFGFAGQAQADAIPVAINALAADVLALKKVITALIDDAQSLGLAQ